MTVNDPSLREVMTESEAADFFRTKADTMRHWRTRSNPSFAGPPWIKPHGTRKTAVLYLRSDLIAWLEQNRQFPKPIKAATSGDRTPDDK